MPTVSRAERLPTVSGDSDSWGTVLNGFLEVTLDSAGYIKSSVVNSTHIVDSTILTGDIAADTIIAGDIATDGVGTAEILDGTITTTDISASAGIADGQIADTLTVDGSSSVTWTALTSYPTGCTNQFVTTIGDSLTCASVASASITDGAVSLADHATSSVNSTHIVDSTILTGDIAADTIIAGDIATDGVGTAEILDGTVSTDDIAANTITGGDIAADTIDGTELKDSIALDVATTITGTTAGVGLTITSNINSAALSVSNANSGGSVLSLTSSGGGTLLSAAGACYDGSSGACVLNDYAELYPSSEPVEQGSLVSIDSSHDDILVRKSRTAYDTSVVGIVSTSPAVVIEGDKLLIMGGVYNHKPLRPAIAMAGRVPVKVTDENGPIKQGDLLVPSSTSGYAMKCDDKIKCFGNVIGKALQSHKRGKEKIIALVMFG